LTLFGSKNVLLADQIVSEEGIEEKKMFPFQNCFRVATDILIKRLSDVRMITLH